MSSLSEVICFSKKDLNAGANIVSARDTVFGAHENIKTKLESIVSSKTPFSTPLVSTF